MNIKTQYFSLQQRRTIAFFKEIPTLIYSASKMIKQPSKTQSSISHLLHSKNTPVPPLHCGGTKMFPSFAILNSQYIIIWIVTNSSRPSSFPSFSPLSCFFFLDRAAGCIVSSQCLASPRVQTFFGNYKQPSQPREAFVDSFPVCINIYQARKHRQMSTMRRFLRVARW